MVDKVPNCYKKTDVDDSAFLMKVIRFDLISILSAMRIILRQCKVLIAQLQVGFNLLTVMLLCPLIHI